ncbi:hypothetical protein [Clostridium sp. D53t1_180928_C8]|uniref:hypothetical protein n=1 Tax=Clostridium sp. D53t1_180928_C8 TaxID=2787101 RepID=UPI0018A98036|nr:hypothetical protein [Clostridium sp. D53t1_180928_C8]
MNIRNETKTEKKLTITETDIVNGGEVLILTAYATKENEDLYSYPAPQIFNSEIYEKNKQAYDNAVREFRQACEVI